MSIQIYKLTLGLVQTNCYIIADTDTRDAVVIDPADRASLIYQTAQDEDWTIREILATHGHFDHIMASAELKTLTEASFRLHQEDLPLLRRMPELIRLWIGTDAPPAAEPDGFVQEGDAIIVGGIALEVLFTPGHTPGHVSYVLHSEKTVFCGDVLFAGSVGRTDLPGASHATLMKSIADKLLPLGDDFIVAPGHMQNTTIGQERQYNPFVVEYLESLST